MRNRVDSPIGKKTIVNRCLAAFWRSLLIAVITPGLATPVFASTPSLVDLNAEGEGETIHVDSTLDDLEENGNCTLREAIIAANTDREVDGCPAGDGDDSLELPAGTYVLELSGTDEDEAQSGDLDITGSLSIEGAGIGATVINAGALDRVFHVLSGEADVSLAELTVENGRANCGGGIYNLGSLELRWVLIQENHAPVSLPPACANGGAVFNLGSLDAEDTYFVKNTAEERGGAIYSEGEIELTRATVFENSGYDGGGIFTTGSGEIDDSEILHNTGMGAGAIFNIGELTVAETTIAYNRAQLDFGGGIRQLGALTLIDSTLHDNVAWESGGAISAEGGSTSIHTSLIANNRAESVSGGGVYQSGGSLEAFDSTISYNLTNRGGGGLSVIAGSSVLKNVTIAYNIAAADDPDLTSGGGGILVQSGGEVQIENSILAQNEDRSPDPFEPDCSAPPGAIQSGGHNLVGQADGCNWEPEEGDQLGFSDAPLDPGLGYLADYGGPTLTFALLPGSPAIDAGASTTCTGTDQRGVKRPQGKGDEAACDIGAYETLII